jgi:hypothetical protein
MSREGKTAQMGQSQGDRSHDFAWGFWYLVPLYPYNQRRTLCSEVVPGTIWTFEQIQGIFYVVVPIRMTVVRLDTGGLLVYAPIAPTPECIRLVQELVAKYGEVKYIILPTTSGLEHKVFVPAFARRFPTAQVFVAPNQWSFPVKLPLNWLGFPGRRTQVLPLDSSTAPFADDFDYAILDIDLGLGGFGEVALLHRRSRTLLVTDSVVSVPEAPPAIVQLDPYPLLFHAREGVTDGIEDNPENRRKGWHRIALFAFYFRPSLLETIPLGAAFQAASTAPDRSRKAYFGMYPFRWQPGWERSFAALRGNGRLFVAPILQTLILNRAPHETLDWANRVTRWHFERVIPCHFDAPVTTSAQQFRQAFAFLEKHPAPESYPLPREDFELLQQIDDRLHQLGITSLPKEKI